MYNKEKIKELAEMYVRSSNKDIFVELLIELHWMIRKQLGKNYVSMFPYWKDMTSAVKLKIWKNRKTLKNSRSKNLADHFYYRIRTHLHRENDRIRKIREDFGLSSGITPQENEQGMMGVKKPVDEEVTAGEEMCLERYREKAQGNTEPEETYVSSEVEDKEEPEVKKPVKKRFFDTCTKCKKECKSPTKKGMLSFQCFDFEVSEKGGEELRGIKTLVGGGLEKSEKNPRACMTKKWSAPKKPWQD